MILGDLAGTQRSNFITPWCRFKTLAYNMNENKHHHRYNSATPIRFLLAPRLATPSPSLPSHRLTAAPHRSPTDQIPPPSGWLPPRRHSQESNEGYNTPYTKPRRASGGRECARAPPQARTPGAASRPSRATAPTRTPARAPRTGRWARTCHGQTGATRRLAAPKARPPAAREAPGPGSP